MPDIKSTIDINRRKHIVESTQNRNLALDQLSSWTELGPELADKVQSSRLVEPPTGPVSLWTRRAAGSYRRGREVPDQVQAGPHLGAIGTKW